MSEKNNEIDLIEELFAMAEYHKKTADYSYEEIEKIRKKNPDNKILKDYYRNRMNTHKKWHDILKKLAKNA